MLRIDYPYVCEPKDLVDSSNSYVARLQKDDFVIAGSNTLVRGLRELNVSLNRGLTLNGQVYSQISCRQLQSLFPNHWKFLLIHFSQNALFARNLHDHVTVDPRYMKINPGDRLNFSQYFNGNVEPDFQTKRDIYANQSGVFLRVIEAVPLGCQAVTDRSPSKKCLVRSECELTKEGFKVLYIAATAPIFPYLWKGDHEALKRYIVPAKNEQLQQNTQQLNASEEVNPPKTTWQYIAALGATMQKFASGIWRRVRRSERSESIKAPQMQSSAVSQDTYQSVERSLPPLVSKPIAISTKSKASFSRVESFVMPGDSWQEATFWGRTASFSALTSSLAARNQLERSFLQKNRY